MSRSELWRRYAWAIVVAVLVAVAMTVLRAEDGDGEYVVIQDPSVALCRSLEPYGYWYFFWNCHEILNADMVTTMDVVTLEDGTSLIVIETKPVKKEQK